jgi:hypothetical protein
MGAARDPLSGGATTLVLTGTVLPLLRILSRGGEIIHVIVIVLILIPRVWRLRWRAWWSRPGRAGQGLNMDANAEPLLLVEHLH